MKSLNSKLFALAATLAIAATTASAQVTVKAAVPFSFETNGHRTMPAGTYVITQNAGVWFFSGEETRHKGMAVQVARTESKKTDTAKLTFACKGNHCALRSVEPGGGEAGGYWPAPRRSKSDAEELARIVTIPAILSAE